MYDEMGIAPVPGPDFTPGDTIAVNATAGTLAPGDTITFQAHPRWPWPVRFGAWLCRVELPPRPPLQPTRQFVVTWTSDL